MGCVTKSCRVSDQDDCPHKEDCEHIKTAVENALDEADRRSVIRWSVAQCAVLCAVIFTLLLVIPWMR